MQPSTARAARTVALAALISSAVSCASVLSRTVAVSTTEPQPLFFMGIKFDVLVVSDQFGHGVEWPLRWFAVLDLPASAVMDVVLLPVDTLVWCFW